MKTITLLGATGSIGKSSLDVIARHPQRFRLHALAAGRNVDALVQLCSAFRPEVAVIAEPALLPRLRDGLEQLGVPTRALGGTEALSEVAAAPSVDTVISAIVGAAGLVPTLAAARAGKRVLLANKEAIVCAGSLLLEAVAEGKGELLPVDSEHSALHQCLAGARDAGRDVRRLILTASGGPFRTRMDLSGVTPDEACAHPNWVMGRKISVDSATLMNKGLEVIEASWLFGFASGRIDVVVHPQSVIHSMVEFADASIVAQLGTPDMRTPIAYALSYPERVESGSEALDFTRLGALTFESPDHARFRCLGLACDALERGTQATAALNAANEIAVEAFLDRRLAFTAIADVIGEVLAATAAQAPRDVADILEIDARSRGVARRYISSHA